MTLEEKANVIREMIRHEDQLLIGRTNWMIMLQGLFFAALAFSWTRLSITLLIVVLGIVFSLLFIPYLNLSDRAIAELLRWWNANSADYDGPPVVGLDHRDVPALPWKFLPWRLLPFIFCISWLMIGFVKLVELRFN